MHVVALKPVIQKKDGDTEKRRRVVANDLETADDFLHVLWNLQLLIISIM